MILFDAVYINNGGGKVLLDILISEIEKEDTVVYYLLDKRIENEYQAKLKNVTFIEASLLKRHQFYKKNELKFSKVFCLGNLPPSLKLNIPVYTYFHQSNYINIPLDLNLKEKIIFKIKSLVFNFFLNNTDEIIVQTNLMKKRFYNKFKFPKIEVFPFFEELNIEQNHFKRNIFLYISLGSTHKNHNKLLEAFVSNPFLIENSELHLTIDNENIQLKKHIEDLIIKGFPIVNHGFLNKQQKEVIYYEAKYVVFPSISESFGLGIIEAIQSNCYLIASNLDYVNDVSEPSLTFNPFDSEDISFKMEFALKNELLPSQLKIDSQLHKLIHKLVN